MIPLQDSSLIPNVTLRRLIQAWCADAGRRSFKVGNTTLSSNNEDISDCVFSFLRNIARGENVKLAVRGLKQLAKEGEENRRCIISNGGPALLVSLLWADNMDVAHHDCEACEDAISILALLSKSHFETKTLVMKSQQLACIIWHLRNGPRGVKIAAAELLRNLFKQDDSREFVGKAKGLFEGLTALIRDKNLNSKGQKVAARVIESACQSINNATRAVEAGAIDSLLGLLNRCEKPCAERALATLEYLCETTNGKHAASKLPEFFTTMIEKMGSVSELSTGYALSCLLKVFSLNKDSILISALDAGIYPKLLDVLQADGTAWVKYKAQELLKRLHRVPAHYLEQDLS
ncbi:hypothetical protein KP509_08G042000 [Ceratopteris richardii]|nr:hypothetical protein KP509_08G042000 [Ceratopteris richardii]